MRAMRSKGVRVKEGEKCYHRKKRMSAHFDAVDVSENRLIETDEERVRIRFARKGTGFGISV